MPPSLGLLLLISAHPLAAQSEAVLRDYFEGRSVALKQPMPGTEDGVDIYPGTQRPLDYPRYAKRLKEYGTAIRSGETVLVTKIKVKSKHIEFQLDGGGYGTMGDETSSNVSIQAAPKTRRSQARAGAGRRTQPFCRCRSRGAQEAEHPSAPAGGRLAIQYSVPASDTTGCAESRVHYAGAR
jgi:hypothetical protein